VKKATARMKILKGLEYTSNISFQITAAILKKRATDQKFDRMDHAGWNILAGEQ
jgi:hypothetical protein